MSGRSRAARWTPEARAAALRIAILFRELPDRELDVIAHRSRVRAMGARDRLWRRGDRAEALALVLRGRLKVLRPGARDVVFGVAVPGEVLGEVAFATGGTYLHDVVCMRSADVLLVPAKVVRAILSRNPRMALQLAMDLAHQVIRLNRICEDLSAGDVGTRLARVLLRLADRTGEPFPGGVLVPVRLRRADLAAMAATTLESTSRRISEWHRRGWLTPQPAGYLLRDIEAFRRLAGE